MKRIFEGHDLDGVDPPDNISNTFWEGRRFYHTAIPTALGSKAASVPHKMHCMLHAFVTELLRWSTVRRLAMRVIVFCTDLGVEKFLCGTEANILTPSFLPQIGKDATPDWWRMESDSFGWGEEPVLLKADTAQHDPGRSDTPSPNQHEQPSGQTGPAVNEIPVTTPNAVPTAAPVPAPAACPPTAPLDSFKLTMMRLLFPSAVLVPGIDHIVNSISQEMTKDLSHFESKYLGMLRTVIAFLAAPWLLERFR